MKLRFLLALVAVSVGILAAPLQATPRVDFVKDWAVTPNLTAIGYAANTVPLDSLVSNSDLAFWGDMVVMGTYDGFVLYDVTYPTRPKVTLNYEDCSPGTDLGNQGDVIVYGNILVRSWNSNTPAGGASCDGDFVPPGFEGLHIFDISNRQNPDLIASVDLACGSHTATSLPDPANGRLLVYNGSSSGACRDIDIVSIPLANPAAPTVVRQVPTEDHPCHDIGIILGDAMKVGCAGGDSLAIYSIGGPMGGTLDDPMMMHHTEFPGVTIGHTAAFTWDGKYAIFGHEPGGGVEARCQATSSDLDKTLFFVEVETGEIAGTILHPRPQTATENCTWHNLNVVPLKNKAGKPRYVLVAGNYQSGISVVDFSDVENAYEFAYADPPPLSTTQLIRGGDWSSYWYNGRIYESDRKRGLIIWRLDDPRVGTYFRTPYSNPQTQEFTIDR